MPAARCASPLELGACARQRHCSLRSLLRSSRGARRPHAEPNFPTLTGRIVDEAGLLTADDRTAIEAELAALEAEVDRPGRRRHASSRSQGYPIEDYGYQLGAQVGHRPEGQEQRRPADRRAQRAQGAHRGRPRARAADDRHMSKLIIENAILPEFRRGDFSGGIRAGVRDIKDVLLGDAEEVEAARKGRSAGSLDFWSVVLIIFWICVVLFVAVRRRAVDQQCSRKPSAGRRRRGAAAPVVVPERLGRVGAAAGRAAAAVAAAGRAAAATSAAAAPRGAGRCSKASRRKISMSLFSTADEQRISEAITQRRARRRPARSSPSSPAQSDGYLLRAVPVGGDRRAARAVAAHLSSPGSHVQYDLPDPARRVRRCSRRADAGRRCARRWCRAGIKHLHARRRAVEQFLVQNLHTTAGRTGRADLRLGRRALRRDPRRHRHRRAGAGRHLAKDRRRAHRRHRRGPPGRRVRRGHRRHRRASSPSTSRPAPHDPNELPDHLIVLQ